MRIVVPLIAAAALAAGCGGEPRVRIDYALDPSVAIADVVRVETTVRVPPGDPRDFTADSGFRIVATGVGYEVRHFDGPERRSLLITHDSTLGYVFGDRFTFVLQPPAVGDIPPLQLEARAIGARDLVARSATVDAAFGADTSVALVLADARCGAASCGANEACCGGACVATQDDVARCGACETACGASGDACSGGLCRCEGGSACAAGATCCAGVGCVDLERDVFACGACGKACAPGEACVGGACACGASACTAGQLCCTDATGPHCATTCACGATQCDLGKPLCCSGACHDPNGDDANCGGCGTTCAGATHCKNGRCGCGASGSSCQAGDACCASGCANLMTSLTDCGACGHACGPGSSCVAGACRCGGNTCNTGETCCGGKCFDPQSSTLHCGGCDTACAAGESCHLGGCQCDGTVPVQHCTGGATCCPNAGCFDVSSDPLHCGRTCEVCASSSCQLGMCSGGAGCPTACGPQKRCCGTSCVGIEDRHCASCTDDCTLTGQRCCADAVPPVCSAGGGKLCAVSGG